jgi:hypothetical protein
VDQRGSSGASFRRIESATRSCGYAPARPSGLTLSRQPVRRAESATLYVISDGDAYRIMRTATWASSRKCRARLVNQSSPFTPANLDETCARLPALLLNARFELQQRWRDGIADRRRRMFCGSPPPPNLTASINMMIVPSARPGAARASLQASGQRHDQTAPHCRDRIGDVTLGPDRGHLWVGNLGEWQIARSARRHETLRGESSPFRRSEIRRRRCTAWRDGESRATHGPRNAQAQVPA